LARIAFLFDCLERRASEIWEGRSIERTDDAMKLELPRPWSRRPPSFCVADHQIPADDLQGTGSTVTDVDAMDDTVNQPMCPVAIWVVIEECLPFRCPHRSGDDSRGHWTPHRALQVGCGGCCVYGQGILPFTEGFHDGVRLQLPVRFINGESDRRESCRRHYQSSLCGDWRCSTDGRSHFGLRVG
jgi:hypothetical protein